MSMRLIVYPCRKYKQSLAIGLDKMDDQNVTEAQMLSNISHTDMKRHFVCYTDGRIYVSFYRIYLD